MKKQLRFLALSLICLVVTTGVGIQEKPVPPFLYKFMLTQDWESSEKAQILLYSDEPCNDSVILAAEGQISSMIKTYYTVGYTGGFAFILKIDSSKIQGKLEYKTNPRKQTDGTKYYFLRDGLIPFDAVIEAKKLWFRGQHA